ncbi:MAG: 7-cyano-7-deazaguanine synthase [Pirellulaceae bacterium]
MDRSLNTGKNILRFEYLSQHVWPVVRTVFKNSITPRCRQCVISSNVPQVTLRDGVCNRCHEFNEARENSAERQWEEKYLQHQCRQLHELLTAHQGRGKRRYDALVLFSGGKDSTYMLYRLLRDYPGLRLLTLTLDNGFYSQIALGTAAQVAKKLDVDHLLFKPRSSVYKSLYHYTLTHVHEGGSYGTVDRFDGTLNQHMGLRFAAEWEIPLMLSGVDWSQALLMGSNTNFEHPRVDLLARVDSDRVERRSRLRMDEIFNEEDRELYWDGSKWPTERIPRFILPFIAWRPDKKEIAQVLEREQLMLPAHSSPLVTNNEVLSVMTAIDLKKLGYCSFEPEFSDMIRVKRNDSRYWRNVFEFVEFLVNRGWFLNQDIRNILQRLDLTTADVGL